LLRRSRCSHQWPRHFSALGSTGQRSTGVSRPKGQTKTRFAFGAWERLEASAFSNFRPSSRRQSLSCPSGCPNPSHRKRRPIFSIGQRRTTPPRPSVNEAGLLASNNNRAAPNLLTIILSAGQSARRSIVVVKLAPDLAGTKGRMRLSACQWEATIASSGEANLLLRACNTTEKVGSPNDERRQLRVARASAWRPFS